MALVAGAVLWLALPSGQGRIAAGLGDPDDDPVVQKLEKTIRAGKELLEEIERRAVKGKNDPTYRYYTTQIQRLQAALDNRKKQLGSLPEDKTRKGDKPDSSPDPELEDDPVAQKLDKTIRAGQAVLEEIERRAVKGKDDPTYRYYASQIRQVQAVLASWKEVKRLGVPEKLMPREKSLLFLLRAEGTQVYRAQRKGRALIWEHHEPDAVLLDYWTGEEVGAHGKGPFWSDSEDGMVTAKLLESAPSPASTAVAWLLLDVTGRPMGRFVEVTHIQRIDTWGGQPPAAAPRKEGEVQKVRYHATYAFWGGR
jgi:hypothetical protein